MTAIKRSLFRTDLLIFLLYTTLLAVGMYHHEMWVDEARPWLIARDLNLSELFQNLHYEAHPAGWYLLLKVLNIFNFPPVSMKFLNAFFAISSFYLISFKSNFTSLQKIILVFNAFLLFQYGILSRSYSVEIFFLFAICSIYQLRGQRPYLWTFLQSALAFIHVFGLVFSTLFLARSVIDYYQAENKKPRDLYLIIFSLLAIFTSVLLLWPRPDSINVFYGFNWSLIERFLTAISFGIQSLFLIIPNGEIWGQTLYSKAGLPHLYFLILIIPCLIYFLKTFKKITFTFVFFIMSCLGILLIIIFNKYSDFNLNYFGQFTIIWICTLWMSGKISVTPLFFLPFIFQAYSGLIMYTSDIRLPYSQGPDVAAFLKTQKEFKIVPATAYFTSSYLIYSDDTFKTINKKEASFIIPNEAIMADFHFPEKMSLTMYNGQLPRASEANVHQNLSLHSCSTYKVFLISNYEIQEDMLLRLNLKLVRRFPVALNPLEKFSVYEHHPDRSMCPQ